MPIATLLLREDSSASLTLLVARSQQKQLPSPQYELQLTPCQLDLVPIGQSAAAFVKDKDEGFESDIDSLSIVSNESETKTTETDSANGSASSDSDTEPIIGPQRGAAHEAFNLVDCCCYTDAKCPDLLVFVIKAEALVFKFDNLAHLRHFYVNFTALKAVTSQKALTNLGARFNLLQRTDNNGVTHIEITMEPDKKQQAQNRANNSSSSSSIISLNTPENKLDKDKSKTLNYKINQRQRSDVGSVPSSGGGGVVVKTPKFPSTENIFNPSQDLKVWSSADDLLKAMPKRPDRRKKKPKAPQPPPPPPPPVVAATPNVLSGQYVRVNVNMDFTKLIAKSQEPHPKKFASILAPNYWTNSVPRLLKPRSKSETRTTNFTPMAYRYIDTTNYHPPYYPTTSTINNRLFGLSPKLRDFSRSHTDLTWAGDCGGGGDAGKDGGSHLKSVIKKENKKKNNNNEKKVTFSAYTTVQVV